jgi:hemerythrin-like domain-containing protein
MLTIRFVLRDPSLVPLSRQHHDALALCVLTERALDSDASEEAVRELARRVKDHFELEVANHFALEEELLFPALRDSGEAPLIEELLADHCRLKEIVERLRHTASPEWLRQFTSLLRAHIRREENELFEQAQQTLPREILDRLGEQFSARAVRICL